MINGERSEDNIEVKSDRLVEEPVRRAPTPPQKQELSIPKQREDSNNNSGNRKKSTSSMSFFRKFSNNNEDSVDILYASVSQKQMYDGLQHLLRGWTKYGLKGVKTNPRNYSINGKLANDNILSLRSTVFEISVKQNGKSSCIAVTKKSGSTKAVKRLSSEIEKVLQKEKVLLSN